MSFTHNGPRRSKQVTQIAISPQTRVLVLESRARELRELALSGDLTNLQSSLVNTELDLLGIAVEHCHALVELERLYRDQNKLKQAEREPADNFLVA